MGKLFEEKTLTFCLLAEPEVQKMWSERLIGLDHRVILPELALTNQPTKTNQTQRMLDELRSSDAVLLETKTMYSTNLIRDFLFGMALGLGKPLYAIGPRWSWLGYLRDVVSCDSFEHFLSKQQTVQTGN